MPLFLFLSVLSLFDVHTSTSCFLFIIELKWHCCKKRHKASQGPKSTAALSVAIEALAAILSGAADWPKKHIKAQNLIKSSKVASKHKNWSKEDF